MQTSVLALYVLQYNQEEYASTATRSMLRAYIICFFVGTYLFNFLAVFINNQAKYLGSVGIFIAIMLNCLPLYFAIAPRNDRLYNLTSRKKENWRIAFTLRNGVQIIL